MNTKEIKEAMAKHITDLELQRLNAEHCHRHKKAAQLDCKLEGVRYCLENIIGTASTQELYRVCTSEAAQIMAQKVASNELTKEELKRVREKLMRRQVNIITGRYHEYDKMMRKEHEMTIILAVGKETGLQIIRDCETIAKRRAERIFQRENNTTSLSY